ncbi:MAG: hypothetical protein K2Q18_04350 [Bdellovibrionales bacterium]|nr:hypothetical protein [Bdellovibrionales bacterium]
MKTITLTVTLLATMNAFACSDQMADDLVLNRVTEMAKRYDTTKVGVGVSILWGDSRITSISILDGKGGNDGIKIDRMGTIFINMDTCVVKAKLIGTFDILDVK